MKIVKLCSILSLAAICLAFAPSQAEARCYNNSRVAVGVDVGFTNCRPVPGYCANRVVVRRAYPAVVQRVYAPAPCCPGPVIVEQPYYEEVIVVPRPVYVARPAFSFSWNFFGR